MFSWIEVRCIDLCRSWHSWELTPCDSWLILYIIPIKSLQPACLFSRKEGTGNCHTKSNVIWLKKKKRRCNPVKLGGFKRGKMKGSCENVLFEAAVETIERPLWYIVHIRYTLIGALSYTVDLHVIVWYIERWMGDQSHCFDSEQRIKERHITLRHYKNNSWCSTTSIVTSQHIHLIYWYTFIYAFQACDMLKIKVIGTSQPYSLFE